MGASNKIPQLREGGMLDYEMETWEVTNHETFDDPSWPADIWTLRSGPNVLFLEHEHDDVDVFRMFKPAAITDVTIDGTPFLSAVSDENAPSTITYQGTEYVLAEENARVGRRRMSSPNKLTQSIEDRKMMGVCGGIAEYTGAPSTLIRLGFVVATFGVNFIFPCLLMPVAVLVYFLLGFVMPNPSDVSSTGDELSHYWIYRKDDDLIVLECYGANDWDVYEGWGVEPYEFNNVLPSRSSNY